MKELGFGKIGKRLVNRFFRQVDGVVWDLMSGKVGIHQADGVVRLEGEGKDARLAIGLFDELRVPLPAFATQTKVDQVGVGDLIHGGDRVLGWVVGKADDHLLLLRPDGTRQQWTPPIVPLLGKGETEGIMVVKSLDALLPGGGLGTMQNALLPLLMMQDDDRDLSDILPLLLLSTQGTADQKESSGWGSMLQTIMMMKLFGRSSRRDSSKRGHPSPGFFDND